MSKIAEELTDAQVEELVEALGELERSLRQHLEASRASAAPVTLDQTSVGRLSRMDAMQGQQMAAANRRVARLRLDRAAAALKAAENDEYGYCRACEEPIGYPRLRAQPETPFCLACQGRRERR